MLSDTTFLLLIKLSLKSKFSTESSPTQVEKAKPNPEIFQLAFNKFGFGADDVAPEEVLVLEDAPLGVRAGLAAGMKVVMVAPWKMPEGEERPHQYMTSMFYFAPEHWGFPAFE